MADGLVEGGGLADKTPKRERRDLRQPVACQTRRTLSRTLCHPRQNVGLPVTPAVPPQRQIHPTDEPTESRFPRERPRSKRRRLLSVCVWVHAAVRGRRRCCSGAGTPENRGLMTNLRLETRRPALWAPHQHHAPPQLHTTPYVPCMRDMDVSSSSQR